MHSSSAIQTEACRLQALRGLHILDTPAEERFDRITRLATRLFAVPVSLVTLIDAERQWFKSSVGVAFRETPRSAAFCTHAIAQAQTLVIPDLLLDERFGDNPFVTGDAQARFYAGHPVLAPDGTPLGTLCVIDRVPRAFDAVQCALLADLAAMVTSEIAAAEVQRADARRRESEAWAAHLLGHIPDGVLMLDGDGVILRANPAAERIFEAGADLQGRPVGALLGTVAGLLLDPARGAPAAPIDAMARRADGSVVPLELKASPMPVNGKQCLAVIVRDVTRERDAEQRGRATEERRRKHFTTATHELRTPMASILGFSELLLKREFDAATSRELAEIIHRQATRLVDLINQLLDLARIEAGGIQALAIAPVTVAALLEQTLAGLDGLGQNHRIRVATQEGMPPLAADARKMQQALVNIVSNSIKYSGDASPIDIGAAPALRDGRPMVAIRVADRGIGMTPEQQANIFNAFYRAGASPDVQGTGLGMTIVKEIVELHGGSVEIVSGPDAGTTVTVWLHVDRGHG